MSNALRPLIAALAVVAWFASAGTLKAGVITTAQNHDNGHTYHLLEASSWSTAQAEAVALGGNLATVRSQAEQDGSFSTFGAWQFLFIGLNDAATKG